MPDDSKKNQQRKSKNDPKDQRKPRQSRHQAAANQDKIAENKIPTQDKKLGNKAEIPKVSEKPTYVEPGPEFYKGLKRETEVILKITEEANTKYKKKEIQSNWSKYELPIDSYEEMEEQENMGADYEKLIQDSQTIGGHFQFKHEKTWDINTGPSLYDKYFEIDMDNLCVAVQTTPFYERNIIDKLIFSETDILNMNNRSTRYKRKYFKDKSFTTPEIEAEEKTLQLLKNDESRIDETNVDSNMIKPNTTSVEKELENIDTNDSEVLTNQENKTVTNDDIDLNNVDTKLGPEVAETDTTIEDIKNIDKLVVTKKDTVIKDSVECNKVDDFVSELVNETKHTSKVELMPNKDAASSKKENPIIESPEDLEKWLDDFLDS